MPEQQTLLRILSDGKFHSGEELGRVLGKSRAAVWKSLKALPAAHLKIDAVQGRGYRLRTPIELLDRARILDQMHPFARNLLGDFEILPEVDSTNKYLLDRIDRAPPGTVCLAEMQTAGRGRRGRSWISPFGSNIYLSLLWNFNDGPARLSGLSLAVAVGCVRALKRIGLGDLGLKWPNDVLHNGKKLAGILMEVTGESNGPCHVVIGAGVNIGMPVDTQVGQPWSDVRQGVANASRNQLVSFLIEEIVSVLTVFEKDGFAAFHLDWRALDEFANQPIVVQGSQSAIPGIARGVDPKGLLLVDTATGLQRFASGEVSLRMPGHVAPL